MSNENRIIALEYYPDETEPSRGTNKLYVRLSSISGLSEYTTPSGKTHKNIYLHGMPHCHVLTEESYFAAKAQLQLHD